MSAAFALLVATTIVAAQSRSDRSSPPDEDRFLNVQLPPVAVTTSSGVRMDLARVADGHPLLLALVFTRCAGVCSPFLASWRAADQWLSNRGTVRRLVLSFDPRDSVADMAAFARHFDLDHDPNWTFAIAEPDHVQRLAAAAGFWYDWDESRQQFDHPAMLAAVRDGRFIRVLVGGTVGSARLDELMREASGEFVPSYPLPGRMAFRCVQYNARTGRIALDWGFLLLLLPAGTTAIATAMVFTAAGRMRRSTDKTRCE